MGSLDNVSPELKDEAVQLGVALAPLTAEDPDVLSTPSKVNRATRCSKAVSPFVHQLAMLQAPSKKRKAI